MSKRFYINDDLTQEAIDPGTDYWEVGVCTASNGVWNYYELKSWDHIAQGIAAVYPNLTDVKEMTIRKQTA